MAIAFIPPCGGMYEAEKKRQRLIREQTTIDPVERYRLREQRLQEGLTASASALIRQAERNAKIYKQINKEN